jgi:2-polyprenyl-3-methyl-5-hydroxy-6-metoxy-1,4-benzoquinol methylase
MRSDDASSIYQSKKFEFGKNWRQFLDHLNEDRIRLAQDSLQAMIGQDRLENKRFLDVGCGSGLFSLAAIKIGAKEVVSFDFDQDSVDCTHHIQAQFGPFPQWTIFQGDILDLNFLTQLGKFDVVYSWGVLHHTGKMWDALENITQSVSEDGLLFISIYNDQGIISDGWRLIKWVYNISPKPIRLLIAAIQYLLVLANRLVVGGLTGKSFDECFKGSERGMSLWYDAVDWVGGYPFETAGVEELSDFFDIHGFELVKLKRKQGSGCNELVFRKNRQSP